MNLRHIVIDEASDFDVSPSDRTAVHAAISALALAGVSKAARARLHDGLNARHILDRETDADPICVGLFFRFTPHVRLSLFSDEIARIVRDEQLMIGVGLQSESERPQINEAVLTALLEKGRLVGTVSPGDGAPEGSIDFGWRDGMGTHEEWYDPSRREFHRVSVSGRTNYIIRIEVDGSLTVQAAGEYVTLI